MQKQTETFEDQEKKQVRAFEEHRKQIAEYNEVTKTDSNHNLGGLFRGSFIRGVAWRCW